ncbi:metal-dependent protein hydrolase [Polychytrium aggregatum]|uniref:metal-dependent protein hydrolase n=1 Tax=Polychytrium aggregatum TaxID=110093 RepID=UPI0022FDB7B8|nr:metal-dependent protein hydrolase [Polychytrium aggregatum]KAI9206710.1 metal-dependent protein hydrolase [Polychytrium aggregatum]
MSTATKKVIATHSGSFHADESLAVYMLRLTKEFAGAEIVRTRDPAVIAAADIVVDVGAEYDPARNRFDHHQREFKDTFDSHHSIRLSSAGLVYKHFGREVLANILKWDPADDRIELVYQKIYSILIESYDAIDNGVSAYPSDVEPKYKDNTGISRRVSNLNPWWNQPDDDIQERFLKAVELCGTEFVDRVSYIGLSWLPAREIVEKALQERTHFHSSGKILVFDQFCPWKEHLYILEGEHNIPHATRPLYALYADQSGSWRVQAVAKTPDSFESRKALPEAWRGIRDEALSELAGIPGCIFVHTTGFIGGNKTKDGALQMALKALDL